MQDESQNNSKKKRWIIVLILLLLLVIAGLCAYIFLNKDDTQDMELGQSEYVKPEEPMDRSKNVTLPGWGGFTIPAGKKTISQGFEFHNPEENFWYEDHITINGKELDETLVVDSGTQVDLDHYLKLANVQGSPAKVSAYDDTCFEIGTSESGAYTIEAIKGFEGDKVVTVETDKGKSVDLEMTCQQECYYMTFGLYLSKNDELLYQSGLVAPGKYIQKMKMERSLKAGTYDAYVVCQPYRSDKTTETNQGVVRITLTVK